MKSWLLWMGLFGCASHGLGCEKLCSAGIDSGDRLHQAAGTGLVQGWCRNAGRAVRLQATSVVSQIRGGQRKKEFLRSSLTLFAICGSTTTIYTGVSSGTNRMHGMERGREKKEKLCSWVCVLS
ncbi:hypothetical protein QBC46DRAFT_374672 [Diplogelasinospora grovesii]|uniref:Secreted protein n=1 Tax=Diplogelasinospora grovesii TaxID=303347 RepID=A0AAN6S8N5_9PEZI|nr:hypothetical protein QBC46DRAFT_374672 [Diplogelasinospora grovesii]